MTEIVVKIGTWFLDAYDLTSSTRNKIYIIKKCLEKSPFLANFRLLVKKILLSQGLLIPRFSRIS